MKQLVYRKRPKAGQCAILGCKIDPSNRQLCGRHRSVKSRLADPVRYYYNNLKNRAGQRDKEFTITLDNFSDWCTFHAFKCGGGRTKQADSIDRKDNKHGYHIWNIKKMKLGDNMSVYKKRK